MFHLVGRIEKRINYNGSILVLSITTQVWPACHDLSVVDYKALTGLLLLQVSYFHARCGASLKDLNLDTTSASKAKCFPVS
jgi:hypothetical protein